MTEFYAMPKAFLRSDEGTPLKGTLRIYVGDFKPPHSLTDLCLSIWITESESDVMRVSWPSGGQPTRFSTDTDGGDMHVYLNDVHLGAFRCHRKDDPEFEPTLIIAFHGNTFKREETTPSGWLELGAMIFNGPEGADHHLYNFHHYSYESDFSKPPKSFGTGTYTWEGREIRSRPSYHTHLDGGDMSHILHSQQIFLSDIAKSIRSPRIGGIYRNELIGFNIAMAPRAAFYMQWEKRHKVDLDWAESLFEFNFHLFGGGVHGIGDSTSVYLGHSSKEENQRELLLLALVMFVSRFGYQPDEIKTGSYTQSIETFSQGLFAYGGGDCEDLSWSIWATIKCLLREDLVVDSKTHPYVDLFRTVFKDFEPHACLVQASAPEFSAKSLCAVAVEDAGLVIKEGETITAEKLEKTEQKAGFFHMVTMMFHKKFMEGTLEERQEYGKYTIVGEGTSSTYPRIFALPGQCKPEGLGQALYDILANKQAEPGAVTVNYCWGSAAKDPTMYITILDSTNVTEGTVKVRQFCTREGNGRDDAGVIVDMIVTNPAQIEILDAHGTELQNEMSKHLIDEITSTQLPAPLLTIDRSEFKKELEKLKPWPVNSVFKFYYSTKPGPGLVPYLPWNMTSQTSTNSVKPWYLGVSWMSNLTL